MSNPAGISGPDGRPSRAQQLASNATHARTDSWASGGSGEEVRVMGKSSSSTDLTDLYAPAPPRPVAALKAATDLPRVRSIDFGRGGVGSGGVDDIASVTGKPRPVGPRAWLRMNESGVCTPITIDKHRLASQLRVPMRDLRMLEPNQSKSYSAAILSRERCLVVHLEQVRLLITAEEVYLQDGRNITVTRYLPELQRRLLTRKLKLMDSHGVPNLPDSEQDSGENSAEGSPPESRRVSYPGPDAHVSPAKPEDSSADISHRGGMPKGKIPTAKGAEAEAARARIKAKLSPLGENSGAGKGGNRGGGGGGGAEGGLNRGGEGGHGSAYRQMSIDSGKRQEVLPFELIALEVALEIVCNQLESEQRDIAMEVRSGLEGLRKKVSTANLERVRKIKSRVTRMTGRVSKVREEIKRYLDDDSDMRDMYLTRKLLAELFAAGGGGEKNAGMGPGPSPLGGGGGSGSYYSPRYSVSIAKRRKSGSWNLAGGPTLAARQRSYEQAQMKASADGVVAGDADEEEVSVTLEEDEGAYDQMEPEFHEYHDHKDDDADLQEVEDLLETYFTHIDSTFAELEALDEFIDDTEDFVNIELDSQRNQLIKLELVLTTATLFVSMYGVVASIFGMNLKNGSEDSHAVFVLVNAVCAAGTILAFAAAVFYIRFKRIM